MICSSCYRDRSKGSDETGFHYPSTTCDSGALRWGFNGPSLDKFTINSPHLVFATFVEFISDLPRFNAFGSVLVMPDLGLVCTQMGGSQGFGYYGPSLSALGYRIGVPMLDFK